MLYFRITENFGDRSRKTCDKYIYHQFGSLVKTMRKLGAFTIVSLDGYFAGPNGEIDWFKTNDEEDRQFSSSRQTRLPRWSSAIQPTR